MASQDISSLFKSVNNEDDLRNKLFGKELKELESISLFAAEKKAETEEEKADVQRSIISKNQREFIKRKLKAGKRSVTIYVDDILMNRLDTEVGYETNRSEKMEEIIRFFFQYKDSV